MTLALDSVDLTTVARDGGYRIVLSGTFELDKPHRVHIGSAGDSSDPLCFSGKPGQAYNAKPFSETELKPYTPRMEIGGPYTITVIRGDTLETDQLVDAITAVPEDYKTTVFDLRKVFPPHYFMGPRSMELLEHIP